MDLGPIIFDIEGTQLTSEDRKLLLHPLVGGLIFFARNYQSPEQIQELSEQVREVRPGALIMVDQEGGRVQRFKQGLTELPALRLLGELWDKRESERTKVLQVARNLGALMATEILSLKVDLSLAPVVDLDKGISEIIGQRAFHSHSEGVIELARAYIRGMSDAGMASTIKHFPGHGSVALDSHLELPIDTRGESEIADDMSPFKTLIQESNVKAVMPAHIVYKKLDSQPAGFSKFWLETLRQDLQFDGVIISDDLTMQAAQVAGNYQQRAKLALDAGCDLVLVCNDRDGTKEILDNLSFELSDASHLRISGLRGQKAHAFNGLKDNPLWQESSHGLKEFEGLCACLNPTLV